MPANANQPEIFLLTHQVLLYADRREGYKHLPRRFWRAEMGRTIIEHAAQLAAWYARPGHKGVYNPQPIMFVDWNWDLAPHRSVKVSIVMFESGIGFVQLGKGRVRSFLIPLPYLPVEEFDTYDHREKVRLFIRRMLREGQI